MTTREVNIWASIAWFAGYLLMASEAYHVLVWDAFLVRAVIYPVSGFFSSLVCSYLVGKYMNYDIVEKILISEKWDDKISLIFILTPILSMIFCFLYLKYGGEYDIISWIVIVAPIWIGMRISDIFLGYSD